MTVNEYIHTGRDRLTAAALECANPLLHMKQIVQVVLGWSTSDLYVKWDEPISSSQRERWEAFVARRLTGEPFQYIVGQDRAKRTLAVAVHNHYKRLQHVDNSATEDVEIDKPFCELRRFKREPAYAQLQQRYANPDRLKP